jgi:oligosaccharide repeat unit polymerase
MTRAALRGLSVFAIVVGAGALITQISSTNAVWLSGLWAAWGLTVLWSLTRPTFSLPLAGVNAAMLVYVIIPATSHVVSGRTWIAGNDFGAGTTTALQISALAQIAFLIGAILARSFSPLPHLVKINRRLSARSLDRAALIALGVGVFGLLLEVSLGGAQLSQFFVFTSSGGYGSFAKSAVGTLSGYYTAILLVAGLALVVVALRVTSTKGAGWALPLIVVAASTLILLGTGQRGRWFVPVLAASLVWFKTTHRNVPPRRAALAALLAILTLFAAVGVGRSAAGERTFSSQTVFNEAFGGGSDLFAPLAGLAETVPSKIPYLNGSSYLETLVFPVPRALWSSKPAGKISSTIQAYDPSNSGIAFPEFGEMYANFGFVGVILGSVLFGFVVELLWIRLADTSSLRVTVLASASFAILLEIFVRGAIAPMLVTFLGLLIATLVLCRRSSVTLGAPRRAGGQLDSAPGQAAGSRR